jgi:histidyl-tRNA synthetase
VALMKDSGRAPAAPRPDAYLLHQGEGAAAYAFALADALRTAGHAVVLHAGGGSFKSQMKKADASGAWLALIAGEDEVRAGEISVKALRKNEAQSRVARQDLMDGFAAAVQRSRT